MDVKIIDKAVRCKSFRGFQKAYPKDYAKLLKLGQARQLYDMYADGIIDTMREPKVDRRKKVVEKVPAPNIRREQVWKDAKACWNFSHFMRTGGVYAEAAKRLGMEDDLRRFFKSTISLDAVFDECVHFETWEVFEEKRPLYAEAAVKAGAKWDVVQQIFNRPTRRPR